MGENGGVNDPGKGKAIASLVLGIIGVFTGLFFGLGCILGIIGVVLAIKSRNASQSAGLSRSGLATAGLVISIIAIVGGAGCLICTACSGGTMGCAGLSALFESM